MRSLATSSAISNSEAKATTTGTSVGATVRRETRLLAFRAVLAWFTVALALLVVAILTSDAELDGLMIGKALLFTSPLLLLVVRGHFGMQAIAYPTVSLAAFASWQIGLGPSMLNTTHAAPPFIYHDDAITLGCGIYAAWWWLYAFAAGPAPASASARWATEPRNHPILPYLGISLLWIVVVSITAIYGRLSNYDPNAPQVTTGGFLAAVAFVYIALTPLIPPLALLLWNRCDSVYRTWLAYALTVGAFVVLFISGGRSTFVFTLGLAGVLLRALGVRLRSSFFAALVASIAILFVALTAYRQALQEDATRSGVSGIPAFFDAATRALGAVVDTKSRSIATRATTDNVSLRLSYAPEYFVAVDYAMVNGPALEATMLAGAVQAIPHFLWAEKNDVAAQLDLEQTLLRTGRYPETDLSPSPILEWVFVFGLFVAPFGGLLYGFLGRIFDHILIGSASMSVARWVLVGGFVKLLLGFECGGDYLFIGFREPLLIGAFAAVLGVFAGRPREISHVLSPRTVR